MGDYRCAHSLYTKRVCVFSFPLEGSRDKHANYWQVSDYDICNHTLNDLQEQSLLRTPNRRSDAASW